MQSSDNTSKVANPLKQTRFLALGGNQLEVASRLNIPLHRCKSMSKLITNVGSMVGRAKICLFLAHKCKSKGCGGQLDTRHIVTAFQELVQ